MKAKREASKIAAACATVVVVAACGPSTSAGPYARPSPEGGASDSSPSEGGSGTRTPAPEFSFETFEGETFSLAEQRGTPVVLNFWESW